MTISAFFVVTEAREPKQLKIRLQVFGGPSGAVSENSTPLQLDVQALVMLTVTICFVPQATNLGKVIDWRDES